MSKAILFNGPPGCGKDTAVAHLDDRLGWVVPRKFATHVKEGTHAVLGLFDSYGRPYSHDFFEDVKNTPDPLFAGMSPRQAYIWFSEEVMKPKFGDSIFGRIEAQKLDRNGSRLYCFSDSGFVGEAKEVVKALGPDNVFLVQILREGCTFDGDSRSYISSADIGIPSANAWQVTNNGSKEYFTKTIEQLAVEIRGRPG